MDVDAGERLRLQGNDAFSTKDWERAVDLYQGSANHGGANAGKTYSNLAATLCKLSRFEEAAVAAERATTSSPTWAKAWWRRGVVAELLKFFVEAHKYYDIAVELEPKEKTFSKALSNIEKRLGKKGTDDNGVPCIALKTHLSPEEYENNPSYVAWDRMPEEVRNSSTRILELYAASRQGDTPTSEQWINEGLYKWVDGMRSGVAHLCIASNPEAMQQYQALQQQRLPPELLLQATYQLFGGVPDGLSMQGLANGISHLGGMLVPIETGGTSPEGRVPFFCPQPRYLSAMPLYQNQAIMYSIEAHVRDMTSIFGSEVKLSDGVIAASQSFYQNIGYPYPKGGVAASPEEAVAYIKQQLKNGKTWDGSLRRYVSLQYRGTIVMGATIRLFGHIAECYKMEQWARKFIDLADTEFKVTQDKAYKEKGTCFRPSFRIGMMLSELQSLNVLRGGQINGPYSMNLSMELCIDIADMALEMEVPDIKLDVACRRKPLAIAHSIIGAHLNTLQTCFTREAFTTIVSDHGLFEGVEGEYADPFALIAKLYGIAAKVELPDSDQGAIYWWAYAANMVQGRSNVYSLGDLRSAIAKAEEAERARDVGLFGVNQQRGGSFEAIAKLTAKYFHDESESFVLPEVKLFSDGSTTSSIRLGDGRIICHDFGEYERKEMEFLDTRNIQEQTERMDTSDIEKKHGVADPEGIPSLETLCVRVLHREECEFAMGETDGAVIYCKAMMAAQKEAAETAPVAT
jgi:tetratricopeptide (TPR) repeat protein